ncbi:MAG: LD-carboxypeptidase [Clostridia bacterium]|nr:LD-carboxypeptidase [Clostridia bacterium]
MIKPAKLDKGDTVATISPSWGCAGVPRVLWQYRLGCQRLIDLGLRVTAAPNSMRGTSYLHKNPQARAEDLMWAFENKKVKAIIANIGGNDSERLLPYLSEETIVHNPKILCGYSDVLTLHLYCHRLGLMTFYGDNLLTTIAENGRWHPYSRHWFQKTFFHDSPLGVIVPSSEWSGDGDSRIDKSYRKVYIPNRGCRYIQGRGTVNGRLFGGHEGLCSIRMPNGAALVEKRYFEDSILFFEDIPEFCTLERLAKFFAWLGENGFLQVIKGIIIGKIGMQSSFQAYSEMIRSIVTVKYNRPDMPIISDFNFGHTSPMFILPYGAQASLNADTLQFSILESGVS